MKRRVIQRLVVVFLLLLLAGGAIVNVAVAWGCALWVNPYTGIETRVFTQSRSTLCVASRVERPGAIVIHCNRSPNPFFTDSTVNEDDAVMKQQEIIPEWSNLYQVVERAVQGEETRAEIAWGWPSPSLSADLHFLNVNTFNVAKRCIKLPLSRKADLESEATYRWRLLPVILPIGVIGWSFVACDLFYAAILWVMFSVPLALRRRRRMQRGLCPACAYPVGTSPVCTECGNQIPFPLRGRAREGVGRTETSNAHDDAERSTHPLAPSLKGAGKDPE